MTRHCYDTAILIDVLRGKRTAVHLLQSHEGEDRAATAITSYELALGATSPSRRRAALELLESLSVLALEPSAAGEAGEAMRELRRGGRTPPLRDLLVAAIARDAGCRLYTTDRRFPGLEGLDLKIVSMRS